jgi:hypothetical protein
MVFSTSIEEDQTNLKQLQAADPELFSGGYARQIQSFRRPRLATKEEVEQLQPGYGARNAMIYRENYYLPQPNSECPYVGLFFFRNGKYHPAAFARPHLNNQDTATFYNY